MEPSCGHLIIIILKAYLAQIKFVIFEVPTGIFIIMLDLEECVTSSARKLQQLKNVFKLIFFCS